jgi:hypothetical protein
VTPEQVSVITAIAAILDRIGTWPIGTLLIALAAGPWIVMIFIAWGQNKRFEAVMEMYEANVQLVKGYKSIAENLQDLVILNTQAITGVKDIAENNLFCPIVRRETKQREVDR